MANLGIAGFEIYFEDLAPEVQQKLMEYKGVNTPEELGYDAPIVIIE